MKIALALATIALAACATKPPTSTGVQPTGPDSFTLTTGWNITTHSTAVEARQVALASAGSHCSSAGKQLMVQGITDAKDASGISGTTSIFFRCLAAGDPALRSPDLRPVPDTVIEDRRKP